MELICKKVLTNMFENCCALDRQTDKINLSFFPAYNFTTPFKGRAASTVIPWGRRAPFLRNKKLRSGTGNPAALGAHKEEETR